MLSARNEASAKPTASLMHDAGDAAAIERILQVARQMNSVDIDYFAELMELRVKGDDVKTGKVDAAAIDLLCMLSLSVSSSRSFSFTKRSLTRERSAAPGLKCGT